MPLTEQSACRVGDLFSQFSEAVIVTDLDRRITYANAAAVELFGHELDSFKGQCTSMLYLDPEEVQAHWCGDVEAGVPVGSTPYRMHYRRADGQAFLGNTLAGPVRNDAGELAGFMKVIRVASVAERAVDVLQRVHEITTSTSLDNEERVQALLELGSQHFQLPLGIQSRVDGETYTVENCVDPDQSLTPGTTFALGDTYCVHTLDAQGPTGFHHAGQSEIRDHPCYQGFGLESYLGCPIVVEGEVYGTLNFSRKQASRPFCSDDRALIQLLAHWVGSTLTQGRMEDRLHELATTDPLTGMLNRRAFGEGLDHAIQAAHQEGRTLAVVSLDLDHFKQINDHFGHPVGDSVLCAVAEVLSRFGRPGDLLARVGGEEFMVVLPCGDMEDAKSFGQALLEGFACIRIPSAPNLGRVSASLGLATLRGDEDANGLLRRVDQAMYRAKVEGRGCLRLAA